MWTFLSNFKGWAVEYEPWQPGSTESSSDDFEQMFVESAKFMPVSGSWLYSVVKNGKTCKMHSLQKSAKAVSAENRQSIARLKTLRHPGFTSFLSGKGEKEGSGEICVILNELVLPVAVYGRHAFPSPSGSSLHELWNGVKSIAEAISFLHTEANLIHTRVCLESVFVGIYPKYAWKLCELDDAVPPLTNRSTSPTFPYHPPETEITAATDCWGLGCLIWQLFNLNSTNVDLSNFERIKPKELVTKIYKRLMTRTKSHRLTIDKVISILSEYLSTTDFGRAFHFLNNQIYTVGDHAERQRLFTNFSKTTQTLHDHALRYMVVAALVSLNSQTGTGGLEASIIPLLIESASKQLSKTRFQELVLPVILDLFVQSTDRAVRLQLLAHLPLYEHHLNADLVNTKIFTPLIRGLGDSHAAIREATLRAFSVLGDRLSDQNLNAHLMENLMKLQLRDQDSCVRTNTTVLLGKLARRLVPHKRPEILCGAFSRPLTMDNFSPARMAGVCAFEHNLTLFPVDDKSKKILPAISCLLVDPDPEIREKCFEVVRTIVNQLEKVSKGEMSKEEVEIDVGIQDKSRDANSVTASVWSDYLVAFKNVITRKIEANEQSAHTDDVIRPEPIEKPVIVEEPVLLEEDDKTEIIEVVKVSPRKPGTQKKRPMKLVSRRVKESESLF